MSKVPVKIFAKLNHGFGLPAYSTLGSSGMDVRANVSSLLVPGETMVVPTGLFVSIPKGYEIQVRPRSGVSLNTKLRVANAPGTVDSDYRGEIGIIVTNTQQIGFPPAEIKLGDRIAQLVLCEVPQIEWQEVQDKSELDQTERGAGGYGSTGVA